MFMIICGSRQQRVSVISVNQSCQLCDSLHNRPAPHRSAQSLIKSVNKKITPCLPTSVNFARVRARSQLLGVSGASNNCRLQWCRAQVKTAHGTRLLKLPQPPQSLLQYHWIKISPAPQIFDISCGGSIQGISSASEVSVHYFSCTALASNNTAAGE